MNPRTGASATSRGMLMQYILKATAQDRSSVRCSCAIADGNSFAQIYQVIRRLRSVVLGEACSQPLVRFVRQERLQLVVRSFDNGALTLAIDSSLTAQFQSPYPAPKSA